MGMLGAMVKDFLKAFLSWAVVSALPEIHVYRTR